MILEKLLGILLFFYTFIQSQQFVCKENNAVNNTNNHPIIIITAFDGFRYDYIKRGFTPVLEELANRGTNTEYMYNVFPTVTNTNFFSIATGLYPEIHGVLGNAAFNANFDCLNDENTLEELFHYNDKVVPLWILNEINGKSRYSGTIAWPGSEYSYINKKPTFQKHSVIKEYLVDETEYFRRIDTAIEWLLHEKTPANLIFLYFGEPDSTGHMHGIDSHEIEDKLKKLNNLTEYFLHRLTENNLRDRVNLIFLSDHGMVNLPSENIIPNFNDFINNETYTSCGKSPIWHIKFKPGFENNVYENFVKFANKTKGFTVFKREEIPERWHFKNCKRNADLLLVAHKSFGFSDAKIFHGDHGYDENEKEMRPFFLANGPIFKSNYSVKPFKNIDIYSLIQHVLQLELPFEYVKPNGTLSVIKNILDE